MNPLTIVLLMLCGAMIGEWIFQAVLFVMYGRRLFSKALAITERSEIGLLELLMFMSWLGFGTFTNFHMCGMMLLFSAMLYMLARHGVQHGLCLVDV